MPSHRFGRGREALSEVRVKLGGPPSGPGGVVRPSRRSGRPSRWSGRGREDLREVRVGSGGPSRGLGSLPEVREG